jgi:hypothetical protein
MIKTNDEWREWLLTNIDTKKNIDDDYGLLRNQLNNI